MDDDDLRRGMPTCHIQWSDATAILAGDALQTQAFAVLTDDAIGDCDLRVALLQRFAADELVPRAAATDDTVGSIYAHLPWVLGLIAIAIGVLLLVSVKPVLRLMRGVR